MGGGKDMGPVGAFLSSQSRKHMLITHHTQGSASLGFSNIHPPRFHSERDKPQAERQPNPSGPCLDGPGHPVSASRQPVHKVVLLSPCCLCSLCSQAPVDQPPQPPGL